MKYCPNCGHPLTEGAKFCSECGYDLKSLTPKEETAASTTTPTETTVSTPTPATATSVSAATAAPRRKARPGTIAVIIGALVFLAVILGIILWAIQEGRRQNIEYYGYDPNKAKPSVSLRWENMGTQAQFTLHANDNYDLVEVEYKLVNSSEESVHSSTIAWTVLNKGSDYDKYVDVSSYLLQFSSIKYRVSKYY